MNIITINTPLGEPVELTDAAHMTAQEKSMVLIDWGKFFDSNFAAEKFTKRLYNHLITRCSFIAHYNIGGFYAVYFESAGTMEKFVQQFITGMSVEYGANYWIDYPGAQDINRAMMKVAKEKFEKITEYISSVSRREIAKRINTFVDTLDQFKSGMLVIEGTAYYTKMELYVPDDILKHMVKVVKFYYDTEEKHQEESDDPDNHIFNSLEILGRFLNI